MVYSCDHKCHKVNYRVKDPEYEQKRRYDQHAYEYYIDDDLWKLYKRETWCNDCERNHLSYKQLLSRQKPIDPSKIAAKGAVPKQTTGDNPAYRFKQATIKSRGDTIELKRYKVTPYNTLMKQRPSK